MRQLESHLLLDALFLVNCWFSNFMNFSSINVSDTKMWTSTSYLWGATWDSWNHIYSSWDWPQVKNFWRGWLDFLHELWLPGHHTFESINSYASDMRLYQWDNYGSLDTTLSKASTLMLLTWDYTSEICRSWGGGAISWLTTPFRAFSLMSTANDFWREREGGNFWSRWLSFARHHIWIHVLNILTNILLKIHVLIYVYIYLKHLDRYFI
jgi:hypothetical protein